MRREGQVWREVDGLERVVLITDSECLGPSTYSRREPAAERYYHSVLFLCWPLGGPLGDYRKEIGHWSEDVPFEQNQHLERVL